MRGRQFVDSIKRAGNGPIQSPVSNPIKNNPNQKRSKETNTTTTNKPDRTGIATSNGNYMHDDILCVMHHWITSETHCRAAWSMASAGYLPPLSDRHTQPCEATGQMTPKTDSETRKEFGPRDETKQNPRRRTKQRKRGKNTGPRGPTVRPPTGGHPAQ